ncbi:MAG TPA: hypothetical protein P5136_06340 [Methanofastidiosum sp.]|nr:hypothetical protein [Methanofastidiosum sp.]
MSRYNINMQRRGATEMEQPLEEEVDRYIESVKKHREKKRDKIVKDLEEVVDFIREEKKKK